MGAIHKESRISGRNLREAFQVLQEMDREELGNDYYNGGWHNATDVEEVSSSEYDSYELSKHSPCIAKCISKPIKNEMKIKTKVTNYPAKGTRKWVTKYEVEHPVHGNVIVSELKQGDAIKKARQLVEKNPDWDLSIHLVKKLTSSSRVADIEYKKSSKERDGVWEVSGVLPY
jgi:hypothetical protein